MNATLQKLEQFGIVPVVVLDDAANAAPLAKALCEGGLACAEVTFRTDAAEESIRIMKTEFPDMVVGAGTVLTTEQVDRAIAAGADGIMVEAHNNPTYALSDGPQSLTLPQFDELAKMLDAYAKLEGREFL